VNKNVVVFPPLRSLGTKFSPHCPQRAVAFSAISSKSSSGLLADSETGISNIRIFLLPSISELGIFYCFAVRTIPHPVIRAPFHWQKIGKFGPN
jgi:hypothetical protein